MEVVAADVAIAGAGPAGATLAALLSERGISSVLVERDTFPRDKLCGEFLSYDALPILEHLGLMETIDREAAPRIDVCRVISGKAAWEFPLPHAARGVTRLLFDDLLLREAERRGATVLEGWTATDLDAGGVTISRDDETKRIEAKVVVGAWGRWGRFDNRLGRAFVRDRSHRHFGFKRH